MGSDQGTGNMKRRNLGSGADIIPHAETARLLQTLGEQTRVVILSALYAERSIASSIRDAFSYRPVSDIAELIRLQDLTTRAAVTQMSELQQAMRTAFDMAAKQSAEVRSLFEGVRLMVASLEEFRSPLSAIAVNALLVRRAFEGIRQDVDALMAVALRPAWELYQLTESLAAIGVEAAPGSVSASRVIEAATLETTRTSEVLFEVLRREASWVVAQPLPASLPTFNLFKVQQREIQLLAPGPLAEGINIEALPSSVPAKLAIYLCHLIIEVNKLLIANGHDPIFKPTNRLVEGVASLGFIVAISRRAFEDLVNLLFQMLYEGSGASSRLSAYLTDEELAPLWVLKQLRLSAFHDVEHGDDREIVNKQLTIADAFRDLIRKPFPVSEEEYRVLQVRLLNSLIRMLELVRSRLSQGGSQGL